MKQNINFDFSQGTGNEDDSFGYLYFIHCMYKGISYSSKMC